MKYSSLKALIISSFFYIHIIHASVHFSEQIVDEDKNVVMSCANQAKQVNPLYQHIPNDFLIIWFENGTYTLRTKSSGKEAALSLKNYIKKYPYLHTLILKDNYLGNEGINFLTPFLSAITVFDLDLRYNQLRGDGMRALLENLPLNLRILDISFNVFTDQDLKAFGPGLINLNLYLLKMNYNNVTTKGLFILNPFLSQSSIEVLDLSDNYITNEGVQNLAESVSNVVQSIIIQRNLINDETIKRLRINYPSIEWIF